MSQNKIIKYRIIGEIASALSEDAIVNFNGVKLANNKFTLIFNYPDKKLYIVYNNIVNHLKFKEADEVDKATEEFKSILSTEITMDLKGEILDLNGSLVDGAIKLVTEAFEIKGYERLSDVINRLNKLKLSPIFEPETLKKIYEAFLTDPIMVDQLKEYCENRKINFDKEANTIAKLPTLQMYVEEIHEIYILTGVVKYLQRYLAACHIASMGETVEHSDTISILMIADKKFGAYMFDECNNGDAPEVDIEKFQKEFQAAMKRFS